MIARYVINRTDNREASVPVSIVHDRRRRNALIDQLSLADVVSRLELFGVDDAEALAVVARNVLKRRLDEQDDLLKDMTQVYASADRRH